ncbi:hypothetical protein QTP88_025117 [Uroleucon formosanum]
MDFLHTTLKAKLSTNAIPSIFEVKHLQKVPQSPAACCKKLDWSDEPFTIKLLPLSLNKSTSHYKSKRLVCRKEMKKVMESQRSGSSKDDIYVPTLWYYDLLLFTKDQERPTDSISNLSENECPVMNEPMLDDDESNDITDNTEPINSIVREDQPQNEVIFYSYLNFII